MPRPSWAEQIQNRQFQNRQAPYPLYETLRVACFSYGVRGRGQSKIVNPKSKIG